MLEKKTLEIFLFLKLTSIDKLKTEKTKIDNPLKLENSFLNLLKTERNEMFS